VYKYTGYPATTSTNFLPSTPSVEGSFPKARPGEAPRELLEKLRELWGGGMDAENWMVLRCLGGSSAVIMLTRILGIEGALVDWI
jgi:hypothetical protein